MTSINGLIINGYTFYFLSGDGSPDGVIIPKDTPLDELQNPDFIESLEIAMEIHPDHQDYAYACNYYTQYVPKNRIVSDKAKDFRDYFVNYWVESSAKTQARHESYTYNTSKNEPKPQKGYIYLIKAIEPQTHYKIGYSNNPAKRIETFSVKLPYPIEVIHLIKTDDMRGLEKSLHNKYADKRVNGEWFALTDSDVQEICAMKGDE